MEKEAEVPIIESEDISGPFDGGDWHGEKQSVYVTSATGIERYLSKLSVMG